MLTHMGGDMSVSYILSVIFLWVAVGSQYYSHLHPLVLAKHEEGMANYNLVKFPY